MNIEDAIDLDFLLSIERLKLSPELPRFRKKWNIATSGKEVKKLHGVSLDSEGLIALNTERYTEFLKDIASLVRKSKCPGRYGEDLKIFLITGLVSYHHEPLEIKQEWNEITGINEVLVRVRGDNKPSDFPKSSRKILANLIKSQPDYKKKKSEWTYYLEHKYIYLLKRKGYSMQAIEKMVKNRFGYVVNEVEIRKIITRFRQRMSLVE
jgi:hypothetical protein